MSYTPPVDENFDLEDDSEDLDLDSYEDAGLQDFDDEEYEDDDKDAANYEDDEDGPWGADIDSLDDDCD